MLIEDKLVLWDKFMVKLQHLKMKEQGEHKPKNYNQNSNNVEKLTFEQRKQLGLALIERFKKLLIKLRDR